ncbi:8616_t:CDS:2 [Ambispora gerdemannii]|uniref:8616_t:CDS:1 n=1 Tax=Ambispora gerdemannii TaxID=144530 RepID=A0A9N9CR89_9GLOM|nr:8616_t:CDS:2 [Ambispora gerdemannii]
MSTSTTGAPATGVPGLTLDLQRQKICDSLIIADKLFNRLKHVFYIIAPIVIGIVLAIVEGLTWTVASISIPFVGVG